MIGKGWLRRYKQWDAAASEVVDVTSHLAATTSAHGGIVADDDSRLTDARTPTAHAASHITGTDKLQLATDKLLGRETAGTGDIEAVTCTAAGRAILDDATAAAQLTTLGLGSFEDRMTCRAINLLLSEMTDPRLLLMWCYWNAGVPLTETDLSATGNTLSYVVGTEADKVAQGWLWTYSMNGTTKYGTVADAANLSFNTAGTTDLPFTVLCLVNVTQSTTTEVIISKGASTSADREWAFSLNTGNKPSIQLIDTSVTKVNTKTADTGLANGWHLLIFTYDGTGGQYALDSTNCSIYVDGVAVAATATNTSGYVAMENLAGGVGVGGNYLGASLYKSQLGPVVIDASEWTAAKVRRVYWALAGLANIQSF